MKKILLLISTIGALLLGACSEEEIGGSQNHDYVSISGNWEMHVTGSKGQDSVIKHPNRLIQLTWSDMTFDTTLNLTVINSQATIGNGVWRLQSYIDGNVPGNYTMKDGSTATYTYTTQPSATDSLNTITYKLTGDIVWEKMAELRYGKLRYTAVATGEDGKTVNFSGTAKSALVQQQQ